MLNSIYYEEISSPIGPLVLCATENGLCHIEFATYKEAEEILHKWSRKLLGHERYIRDRAVLGQVIEQLKNYFSGALVHFNLPLDMQGTIFQRNVWQALTTIPYGETRSYKQIAEEIGNPNAVRAVGGANNRNPLPIIVPCHRVIGANGEMVGYGGGLPIKQFLLDHESQYTSDSSV
ncbi:MAG: [Fe-S]-binding protein [Bacilli bacterium]|nr:[Fe-S]-binding protein [Bacilli bacterium]